MKSPLSLSSEGHQSKIHSDVSSTARKGLRTRRLSSTEWKVLGCIALSFVLFATALRDGHDWGGDFAQYILHAQALLNGQPYAPMPGYIDNPFQPWVPQSYPPLLPILYTGILSLFGLNFVALKMLTVLSISLGLLAYWKFLRPSLSPLAALGAISFLAFSPYMLKFSNKILSDIPYIAFTLVTILAAEKFFRKNAALGAAAALGTMFVLTGLARFIGITLICAAPVYAICFKRSHLWQTLAVSGLSMALLHPLSSGTMTSYVDVVGIDPVRMLMWLEGKPTGYFFSLARYLAVYPDHTSPLHYLLNMPVGAIYLGLTVLGAAYLIRKEGVRFRDVYVVVYLGALFAYSIPKLRYLVPIVPLISLYAFQGLRILTVPVYRKLRQIGWNGSNIRRAFRYRFLAPTMLYVPLFLAYWINYAFLPVTAEANILKNPDVSALFEYVRTSQPSGAIFARPRVLSLFTGSRSTCTFNAKVQLSHEVRWDFPMLSELATARDISHVILSNEQDATTLAIRPIVSDHPEQFELVYQNPTYKVYVFQPPGSSADAGSGRKLLAQHDTDANATTEVQQ